MTGAIFGSFIKSSISSKLWKRSAPQVLKPVIQTAGSPEPTAAEIRQRTLIYYCLRLFLSYGLLRGPVPRMASPTSKPPSKPVQALVWQTVVLLLYAGGAFLSTPCLDDFYFLKLFGHVNWPDP